MTKSRHLIAPKQFWTDDQLAWLIALFPGNIAADIAFALGRSVGSIHQRSSLLGLQKTPEHAARMRAWHTANLTEAGKPHRIKPGNVPLNKGRVGYCAPGSEKGWFQKGHQRNDTAPVGAERIDKKNGYIWVKVADKGRYVNPWRLKHQLVWEAVNGPIPAGFILNFIDRQPHNCSIGNLELITLAENMRSNTIHNLPPDLKHTVQVLGQLKRRINERQRKQGNQQPGHAEGPSVRHAERLARQEQPDGS